MASEQVDERVGEQYQQGEPGEYEEVDFEYRPIRYYIDHMGLSSISTTESQGLGELIARGLERQFAYRVDRHKIEVQRGEQTFRVWAYHPQYADNIRASIQSWIDEKAQAHVEGELDENCTLVSVGYYFQIRGIEPTKEDIEGVHWWMEEFDFPRTLDIRFKKNAELFINGEKVFTYHIDPSHQITTRVIYGINQLYPTNA